MGKDGVVRGYKIRIGNGYVIERPVQLIADLEIGGETANAIEDEGQPNLNPEAQEFVPQRRGTRFSKEATRNRITGNQLCESENGQE